MSLRRNPNAVVPDFESIQNEVVRKAVEESFEADADYERERRMERERGA